MTETRKKCYEVVAVANATSGIETLVNRNKVLNRLKKKQLIASKTVMSSCLIRSY
jgi:hypothetical protein